MRENTFLTYASFRCSVLIWIRNSLICLNSIPLIPHVDIRGVHWLFYFSHHSASRLGHWDK